MDPISIILMLITVGQQLYPLVVDMIQAYREKDDAKMLTLLDQALAIYDQGREDARAQLEAYKARVQARIDAKFPVAAAGPKPTNDPTS